MSNNVLIIGETGSGKSSSIRNLNPKETFIINVLGKPLPFKSSSKMYKNNKDNSSNLFVSDNHRDIVKTIHYIDSKMPNIKNVIIDDFQFIMANEFMNRALEKGFEKFSQIGQHAWIVLDAICRMRDDITTFTMSHSETDSMGRSKCKTIGRMLDEKITIESMFTVVLHAKCDDGKYLFLTNNDGFSIAKSPMEMFETQYIDNDLNSITEVINNY